MPDHDLIKVMSAVDSDVKQAASKRVFDTSPMMTQFEAVQAPSGSHQLYVEGELPDPQYVAYNKDPNSTSGSADEPLNVQLKKFQEEIRVDSALARRQTRMGQSYLGKETDKTLRAMGLNWKQFVIGRNNGPQAPRGLYGWVDFWKSDFPGLEINFATDGDDIPNAGPQVLQDKLSELIDAVYYPDFFLTNRTIIRNIKNLIETGAATEKFANKVDFISFEFASGKVARSIMTYEGIPFFAVDLNSQRQEIMAFDEAQGAGGSVHSSILAVRTDTDDGAVLLYEDPEMLFDIADEKRSAKTIRTITSINGVSVEGNRAVARLRGISAP